MTIAWMLPALTLIIQPATAAQPPAAGENVAEEIACAPMSLAAPPQQSLRVSGGYVRGRMMFGPGEPVLVNAGTKQGLRKGQVYFVRRYVQDMFTPASIDFTPVSIHTAGWVTIVDARDDMAVAEITHACDGILDGDYLEPYAAPVVPTPETGGTPDYDHPARVVMGDETMQTGSPGALMLLNRGSDHGVHAGQTLTIYRATREGAGPSLDVGRGTIIAVRPQTSVMRIDESRDAVYIGDLAAIHRIQ